MFKIRVLLVLTLLLFLVSSVNAQQFEILNHTIDVTIDEYGKGDIVERFSLFFVNNIQLELFKEESQNLGVDLGAWEVFDSRIRTYIGKDRFTIAHGTIGFDESSKILVIEYTLTEPIMERIDDTSRVSTYKLKTNAMITEFIAGSFWEIPDNTTINFILPPNSEIKQPVSPEAVVSGSLVTWQGYKSSNQLNLQYDLFKEIAPAFDISKFILDLTQTELFIPVLAVFVIVIGIVYWRRDKLSARIENYVIRNSEITPKEEEEHFEPFD